MPKQIQVNKEELAAFCRRNNIARLSFFGSVLSDDFTPESDIDVLVVFEEGRTPGFLEVARIERELSEAFDDRKVDLRTFQDLSRYFRKEVLASAEVQYA